MIFLAHLFLYYKLLDCKRQTLIMVRIYDQKIGQYRIYLNYDITICMIKICFLISGFYGNKGGSSPKWKHDKYEEVVQMEEPSSTTDN